MVRALVIGSAASVVSLILAGPLISVLERFGIRKAISEEGPDSHMVKAGTATMGGLLLLLVVAAIRARRFYVFTHDWQHMIEHRMQNILQDRDPVGSMPPGLAELISEFMPKD